VECERCGRKTIMQVQAVISAPGDLENRFTKANLRRKDVHLIGCLWDQARFICDSCGHVSGGAKNYITQLENEITRLKALTISEKQGTTT